MAGGTTATVTPGPDTTSAPAMMLSGGMQGSLPPEVTNAPPQNVQPQASDAFTMQPGASSEGQQPQQMLSGPANDPEMHAAAVHHGRIGNAIDAVTKALGGSRTMHVVEMPDGSYVAKEMDSTPGERWSRIAKAALTGAAQGFAHGQGPGGGARAFAAGAQTGLSLPQAEQDKTMQKAEELEGQREKQMMFRKNMAMADLQATKLNLDIMQSPVKFAAEMQTYADTQQKNMTAWHGVHLAHYANAKDLSDHVQTNQELLDHHTGLAGGTLYQIPKYSNGQVTGYDVYGIPADTLNQYNDKEEQVLVRSLAPDHKSMQTEYRVYPPGKELNSNIIADRKLQDTQNAAAELNFAKLQNEKQTADAATMRAETDKKESVARIANLYSEIAKRKDDMKGGSDEWKFMPNGELDAKTGLPLQVNKKGETRVMTPPDGVAPVARTTRDNFINKYQAPALKAEESYNMLTHFDPKNPQEQRIALRMAMGIAAGLSPGAGAGGKGGMSKADFHDAMKSRGLAEDKINLFQRLIDGQQITPNQMGDVQEAYNLFRRTLWKEAVSVGAVSGIPRDAVVPATVAGRDKIISENYAAPAQAQPQPTQGTGDASQAARAPVQQQPPTVTPPAGATMEYKDSKGNVTGWAVNGRYVAR